MAVAYARGGLFRRVFSTFNPPPAASAARPQADPSTNLFVSGLNKSTTTEKLKEAFVKFGEVVDAKVVTDRVTGYSRGFGFVKYANLEGAANGIKGMDGKFLDGWVIFAEYARPRPPPQQYQASQTSQPYQTSEAASNYQ
ncbi:glycine-rich RNA-binding protein 3 [Carex littledalei]|uniref:Glycine-rich RNA-binding protein 3 n=1 Tax=Carex littledalei TaxID=544730 RepID=A0A833VYW9_9POAL|nr:glycine-rich RNA-binding protein 3 [Carex littledalei]